MKVGKKLILDVGDEIIEAHPLTGKGLTAYRTFLVKNSPWVKELEEIDKSHPQHDAMRWRKLQHYMLCFKDRIFEAISETSELLGTFPTLDEAIRQALMQL